MSPEVRVAVLTDVHGNAFALKAVLQDIRRHAPDVIVNLGDQVWGQADPAAALTEQRALGAVEVRGNNDERLVTPAAELPPQYAHLQAWLVDQLPRSELERLAALPTTASLVDGVVLAAHGTPTTPWDSLLLGWDGTGYARRPAHEVRERLSVPEGTEVVLVGHMHREDVRVIDGRLLVQVGPVSAQGDGDPRARWALLTCRDGRWRVEARRVTYDWAAAAKWEREHGPIDAVNHACPPDRPMYNFDGTRVPLG